MENSERPEKRRKLDEVHDVPGSKNSQSLQEPGAQMTLGERKRNGPRVLVNKLNVNHNVIERLRRITKMCGKHAANGRVENQSAKVVEVDGSNPTENGKEITNGSHNEKDEDKRPPQENGGKESSAEDSEQSVTPAQNGVKHMETESTENEINKSEDDDNEIKLQTAADVDIFRQVLKELIEQRTKVVEEAVAADSIKLQNRIRDLERENRELQWNARKLFGAFRQFIIENQKRKQPNISQSVQVNMDSNLKREVPASPVIPVPQTTSVAKPSCQVTTAGEIAGPSITPVSTPPARLTSLPTNVVTLRSDPGLAQSLHKSTIHQSSLQVTPNIMSHSQHKSTEPLASTAVVYTVKPRLAQLAVQHDGNKEQNRFHTVSHSPAIETNTRYLQARTGPSKEPLASKTFQQPQPLEQRKSLQSAEPLASKTFQQPQPLEQRKSLPGAPSKVISPSQTNSTLEMMRQNQQKLLQQRQMMQQQKQSLVVVSSAQQQIPSQSTASLLQQLQLQQQLQQQQHYQRLAQQQQKSQVRHPSAPPSQMSQQEQYRKQQSETPLSSVSASAQQQQEPSLQQKQQQQLVRPSSGLLPEGQQFVRSPTLSAPQQRNHSPNRQGLSQGSMYSSFQRQSNSQPSTASNPPPHSFSFNARHLNNVLKRDETSVMTSVDRSQVPFVPSQQVALSPSTSPKQTSVRLNLVNSNTLVQDHINKIVNHPHNGRLASPVQATAKEMKENPNVGVQQSATLQRQETVTDRSSSSQAVSTMQFRKSFPGQTLQTRTELVSTHRYHSRPPPESLRHVQQPNTQAQQGDRQLQQPQPGVIQNHSTPETGRENVSTVENSQLRGASSALSNAVLSTYRKVQPRPENQSIQQSILVPARKKHTNEELLPSGYRFSLPSPEYLLQRERLQQQTQARTQHTQHTQNNQISKSQSLQNTSSNESSRVTASPGQTREPTRMQSPAVEMVAIQTQPRFQSAQNETRNDRVLNQNSRNEVLPSSGYRPSSENWLTQQKQPELQVQHPRQTHQSQSRQVQQPLQRQNQANASQLTRERGTQRINLQSLYRPPIQSPGISSSDPRNEKHLQDAERRTSVSNSVTANNSSNDNGNAHKPLPKPSASIAVMDRGIVLSWNMEYDDASIKIDNYELFACQDFNEIKGQPIKWKKIGIVKALPLPMACTLTQFSSGSKYCFSVRAVDEKERAGPFSDPCTVSLNPS